MKRSRSVWRVEPLMAAVLLVAALAGVPGTAWIDLDPEGYRESIVVPADGQDDDLFGSSLAVATGRLLVGAPGADAGTSWTGAVYLYEPDATGGWTETKVWASDRARYDAFGASVDMDGDRFVVGAPYDDDHGAYSGAVYVFERNGTGGWHETKITPADGGQRDHFGRSVALNDDVLVVGAPLATFDEGRAGAIYVYERRGVGDWHGTRLEQPHGDRYDWFGFSVATDGHTVVAGAPERDDGRVMLYEPDGAGGWSLEVLAPSGGSSDFGRALALVEGTLAVGAPGGAGAVHVFRTGPDGWAEERVPGEGGGFGAAVATNGQALVVGAPLADQHRPDSGAAYVYRPDGTGGWEVDVRTAGDAQPDWLFGTAVAVNATHEYVGAPRPAPMQDHSGALYVFEPACVMAVGPVPVTGAECASLGQTIGALGH